MAQSNNISPVSFFPDTRSSRVSEQNNKAEGNNQNSANTNSSFDKSLSSALTSKQALALQAKPQLVKMDKPKMMNREPFFPKTPMPYHPEPASHRPLSLAEAHPGPALDHLEEVRSSEQRPVFENQSVRNIPVNHEDSEAEDPDRTSFSSLSESGDHHIDDRRGVMNESYERSAVSYPVSRVAKESIDDETKESLKEKGLWEVPTMFAAQPTQKTQAMAEIVEKGVKESKVPVQKPIAQFMASLENELGVSHDRLVMAFQNLPPGTLQQSPRETMTEVVKQLNLTGEDEGKAVQLYSKMLAQMEMLDKPEQAPQAFSALAGAGAMGEQLKDKGDEMAVVGNRMASKEVAAKYSQSALKQEAVESQSSTQSASGQAQTLTLHGKNVLGESTKGFEKAEQGPNADARKEFLAGDQFKGSAGSAGKEGSLDQQSGSQTQSGSQSQTQGGLTAAVLAGKQGGAKIQDDAKVQIKGAESKVQGVGTKSIHSLTDSQVNSLGGKVDNIPSQDSKSLAAMGTAGTAGASKAQEGDAKHEAIQSIVKNAQLLASKGGGEMHMTLKPEHLGEIHMRVIMDGQKVDVQMTTEKSEVKKLIEQSVHELKHGLASHDLNMEKLNVTLNNKNTQSEFQQGHKDFAQAREFAQQFHQQNQARREMAEFDVSNSPNLNRGGLGSRAESASRMMASQVGTRGPGRLNVVA